jgi:hypothetical protein
MLHSVSGRERTLDEDSRSAEWSVSDGEASLARTPSRPNLPATVANQKLNASRVKRDVN